MFQIIGGIAAAILGLSAIITNVQTCHALRDNRASSEASQRAYVQLGSESGALADFGLAVEPQTPIIVLYFFNSGQSIARHFRAFAYSYSKSIKQPFPPNRHRHRFKIPLGDLRGAIVVTIGEIIIKVEGDIKLTEQTQLKLGEIGMYMAQQSRGEGLAASDIPSRGLQKEYVVDSKWLLTRNKLDDKEERYTIFGDFEYCDIFGIYHCEKFSALWHPLPVGTFMRGVEPHCVIEKISPEAIHLPNAVEIEACEQPNEPEYAHAANISAPPTAEPTP